MIRDEETSYKKRENGHELSDEREREMDEGGNRMREGNVELTFDSPSSLSQNSFASLSNDFTSTLRYRSCAVASKNSIKTAPRAARVEGSDCSKMRRMTSQGKERVKGTI